MKKIGIGLLGLGTVGQGVANIINNPNDRHPLVGELELVGISVRDLQKKRQINTNHQQHPISQITNLEAHPFSWESITPRTILIWASSLTQPACSELTLTECLLQPAVTDVPIMVINQPLTRFGRGGIVGGVAAVKFEAIILVGGFELNQEIAVVGGADICAHEHQ